MGFYVNYLAKLLLLYCSLLQKEQKYKAASLQVVNILITFTLPTLITLP